MDEDRDVFFRESQVRTSTRTEPTSKKENRKTMTAPPRLHAPHQPPHVQSPTHRSPAGGLAHGGERHPVLVQLVGGRARRRGHGHGADAGDHRELRAADQVVPQGLVHKDRFGSGG